MTAERPILIVDDDDDLRETLVEQLSLDGEFTTAEAASIAQAEARLAGPYGRYDAIILDIGLPDGDGRDLCTKLRQAGNKIGRAHV